jgi:4-hydroxybenzoate polyprenyltransferase
MRPLCVDLDGTLIKGDISVEAAFKILKDNPLELLKSLILGTRSKIKAYIAEKVLVNPDSCVFNRDVVEFLREEKAKGRSIYLVSASTQKNVELFKIPEIDECIGATPTNNLKGKQKAKYLKDRFGEFDYVGNSHADLPVWKEAKEAIVVNAKPSVLKRAKKNGNVTKVIGELKTTPNTLLSLFRWHQWSKNLLLFLPLLLSHLLTLEKIMMVVVGFVALSLVCSSIYILNDLHDIESDRAHPLKSKRPIPAGLIELQDAVSISILMFVIGILVAFGVSAHFLFWVGAYALIAVLYSLFLKRLALVDMFVLSGFYVIRVLAGGAAAAVPISPWMLSFSLFFFLSLGASKRFVELSNLKSMGVERARGRDYATSDRIPIGIFGVSAGYISIVIFTLYLSSLEIGTLYRSPERLWGMMPVLLYWISRLWLLAFRGSLHEDPVVFAFKDTTSYITLILCALFVVASL